MTVEYTQPLPSDDCSGCEINVSYNFSAAVLPNDPAIYIEVFRYEAQAVHGQNGSCVTDSAFPVNFGGHEIMTISTRVNSEQYSAVAEKAISQFLGTSLCITTAYTTVGPSELRAPAVPTTLAPSTMVAHVQFSFTDPNKYNSSTSVLSTSVPKPWTSILTRKATTSTPQASQTKPAATTTSSPASTGRISQPAFSPGSRSQDPNQKLQIIAGVVTSILGIAAIGLAILLWRRYRRLRRDSVMTDDSFFRPKPDTDGGTTVAGTTAAGSLFKGSISTDRKDACELPGETGSMDVRWRETYYEERKTIPQLPQELKGAEPPRFEMGSSSKRKSSVSPLTP